MRRVKVMVCEKLKCTPFDVFVTCEDCEGNRFNAATLEVKIQRKVDIRHTQANSRGGKRPLLWSTLRYLRKLLRVFGRRSRLFAFGAAIYNPIRRRSPEK